MTIGETHGRLTFVSYTHSENSMRFGDFKCACGALVNKHVSSVKTGRITSCGCARKMNPVHSHAAGGKVSPTYVSWRAMKARCLNPRCRDYSRYGAAGVAVCDRWRDSFPAFLSDMGERPDGMSIDRIDGTKGYEPGNCRWATLEVQNMNKKTTRWIRVGDALLTRAECAELAGVPLHTIANRLRAGLSGWQMIEGVPSRRGEHFKRGGSKYNSRWNSQRVEVMAIGRARGKQG